MNLNYKIGTMYRAKKPLLCDLNEHLICKLCKGYFIDATTVIECLHTFCRSCIIKYLETNKYCPICDVQVHKSKPLLSLRPDKIIQDAVYKIVPRLYQSELRRRREFQKRNPNVKLLASEECFEGLNTLFLSPEEELCVTLTYYGSLGKPRYLRCPSAVSVMVLQKLIRAKFGLSDCHHVDILHNQDCLSPLNTLMEIVYIYKLSKLEPVDLTYRIYEYMAKKLKLENRECKNETTDQQPTPNNNNWKEVQLRISENGEMSITGIQDDVTSGNFSDEMIELLDSKPKSPVNSSVKKKETGDLKIVRKPKTGQKCINIISETVLRSSDPLLTNCMLSNAAGNKGICNVTSSVTVPSINSQTSTVFTTVNSTKCSVGVVDDKKDIKSLEEISENVKEKGEEEATDCSMVKGIKRKFDDLNNGDSKMKKIDLDVSMSDEKDCKKVNLDDSESEKKDKGVQDQKVINCVEKKVSDGNPDNSKALNSSNLKSISNNGNKPKEEIDKLMNVTQPPKPSTKYQGASQPCYMPKSTFNPVLNIPKLHQSNATLKNDIKSTPKALNAKNEIKTSTSSSVSTVTSNSSSPARQKLTAKAKSNSSMGYKTLKNPPNSWNSQISKANMNKAQPDAKYSDLKNVRPAKFFKMRNNMLRFLGNPASGVKPMYSVHAGAEQEKTSEKILDNKEIKKHSIVKIDPKTLKPITEKAPETSSLSGQISTTADLKINTSSVSIFNPLKLQSHSPKSERKSPQSPKGKSSPSPSPPVPKRDKPNLNFTPPNPFVPNLSSQTVNPNQFLCNTAFPSYDPRVMAAYHNLFYGTTMGFPPSPLSYHLGGLEIAQRGKGFDISKIVGMQQQQPSSSKSPLSTQSTSKLEVPIVPPQLPYQPRQSPKASQATNATSSSASKRPTKDASKNEKSLQNTVEKLTLNRAKEINRAAEALNKRSSPEPTKNDADDKKGETEKGEDEARGTQVAERAKETGNETPPDAPSAEGEATPQRENGESSTVVEETTKESNEKPTTNDALEASTDEKTGQDVNSNSEESKNSEGDVDKSTSDKAGSREEEGNK